MDQVELEANIAKNQALKENVFMMIICIELRIPLFLVGKPGSSKSLAKTIVADAMQGKQAKSPLFRNLKQVTNIDCTVEKTTVFPKCVVLFLFPACLVCSPKLKRS